MNFDIEAIKRKMLVKYPFFGSVVANVDYRANENVRIAGTDGKVIHYNPGFLEELSASEQVFTFAHEVCHIAFNHILRCEGKDLDTWNIATDAVINAFLKKDGLKLVEGVVDIADAINYDAEQLYEKLLKEKQQQNSQGNKEQSQDSDREHSDNSPSGEYSKQQEQKNSQGSGNSSSDSESQNNNSQENGEQSSSNEKQDVGHDTHSMWEEAVKKHREEQAKKNKNKDKDKQEKEEKKSEIEKKQEEIEKLGEKETFRKNQQEKKKELEELKKALSKQAMGPGSMTNGDNRNITDIGRARPLIDWRYVLREAIKYDVDWSYRNAYIEDGVVSAKLEEQPMPETEIVLDTSGSINETLLKNFLRECKNILQHSRLKVGCFDTKFYGFNEIRTEVDIENMKFVGGGGTNFDVAVRAFTRRVENKIIFTDGDAHMPDMPLDAIWMVFGEIQINPRGGKVIQIDGQQLDKLYSYQHDSLTRRRNR